MGRPEPCVLFAQTFVHPQLDEYVDEVLFGESIVITACEFLEQNASSASSVVTLVGATSPPSFALEVFVQCEGEPRFRRLCQPFLYSHSSSNMLEVEAVVTNHLVVRGSYRSLTLVVYGNTAEDLGQFNIEFDLDSSLANLVCSPSEGRLEDLPPALHSTKFSLEESISFPKLLSLPVSEPDLSFEIEQFLQLIIKFFGASGTSDGFNKVASTVISAVSSYVTSDLGCTAITWNQCKQADLIPCRKELQSILNDAKNELHELYNILQYEVSSLPVDLLEEGVAIKSDAELVTALAEYLPDVFSWFHLFRRNCPSNGQSLSQNKSMILGLSMALFLCSAKETCFQFVNGGGMEQLVRVFHHGTQKSAAVTLTLLGVIERATRYAIGCEGFLGWWPREDEIVPVGVSEGYSQILKLLLRKQQHGIASVAAYLLHRLRFYEVAARYESAVLSVLAGLSDVGKVTDVTLNILDSAKLQLKKLLKLLNSRGPIEDPSPVANAHRSLILGQTDGLLSYRATIKLIASSNCCFADFEIDSHLLSLLKERGFLPLSAALLSSSSLRSEKGHTSDTFLDIASLLEAILLSLLVCRSGLVFLLLQPEVAIALVHSLKGVEDMNKEECVPLRFASVLINKGFFCRPQDVGRIIELHLRVVNAIDRLLASTPQSEELLWVLWELCGLSRSDSGRQALLVLGYFPEAVSILMEALQSAKESEPVNFNSGSSPLNLAIFHSAAEIFEIIVSDSTASSLGSWIQHSVELHKALHSSSPGSNRKDAPTRLLEWIDAGVVYQKNGAIGLLRYAAVLASGGDAHLTSASILVSDSMDVENVVGDSASGSDIQVIDNLLGKLVSDKYFDGVTLRDSSIAQLTTTFRILSFIAENSLVAGALYDEGAVTLIYVILVNCKSMLERSSNTYDYLVDEGAECNSMSDLLLERGREQSLVDLMIPSLVLLITLLHKLQIGMLK
ncbi:virilizer [Thalictrum thalictroides]|uniref:Virilizer n=1 Tax=Thalictrum thalictroides TaxID=46969 RepID=A0A7J6VEQ9_THATH|nr:virilizer [Thalictrum thalictroides]